MAKPRELPEPQALRACALFNLRKAARAATHSFEETMRPVGLKGPQFSLLAVTYHRGPLTVGALAEEMATDRTTISRNLRPLERRGLVQLATGSDRRVREVSLTEEGREVFRRALPLWSRAQGRVIGGLGAERFRQLIADLDETVDILRD